MPSLADQFTTVVEHEPGIRARLADYFAKSNLTAPAEEAAAVAVEIARDRKEKEAEEKK